jgi:hypothetical protein
MRDFLQLLCIDLELPTYFNVNNVLRHIIYFAAKLFSLIISFCKLGNIHFMRILYHSILVYIPTSNCGAHFLNFNSKNFVICYFETLISAEIFVSEDD